MTSMVLKGKLFAVATLQFSDGIDACRARPTILYRFCYARSRVTASTRARMYMYTARLSSIFSPYLWTSPLRGSYLAFHRGRGGVPAVINPHQRWIISRHDSSGKSPPPAPSGDVPFSFYGNNFKAGRTDCMHFASKSPFETSPRRAP